MSFLKSLWQRAKALLTKLPTTRIKSLFGRGASLVTSGMLHFVLWVLIVSPCCLFILKAKTIHTAYIRNWVGSQVFMVQHDNGSGGTGFAVKAPSGRTYLLTNDHICAGAKDNKLWLSQADGFSFKTDIISRSQTTDLCLMYLPQFYVGLDLAAKTFVGDQVQAVGHPKLMPLTVSNVGDLIYVGDAILTDSVRSGARFFMSTACDVSNPKFKIKKYKNREYCEIYLPRVFYTNVLIRQGNSGSPLVNFYGDVVGVVSGKDESDWGLAVALSDVYSFLADK